MIQKAIEQGYLPESVTAGMIILLYKGGPKSSLSNSITLLNVTYKILAKVLQLMLKSILMEVISPDQSAFLPMKFILDNILLMHETINHPKSSSQPLLFLKLDFAKAYDKVDLTFLFNVMSRLGLPDSFDTMTQLLFSRAKVCISINGRNTKPFRIG